MAAVLENHPCGICRRDLGENVQKYVKIKNCGHVFHEKCFLNDNGRHVQITQRAKKYFCPEDDCDELIVSAGKKKFNEKLIEKIEIGEFVKPQDAEPPVIDLYNNDTKGLKIITYIAVAMAVMMIAVAIHQSIIALGVGFVLSIPLGSLVGRQIDRYMAV